MTKNTAIEHITEVIGFLNANADYAVLRNFEGVITTYTEPKEYHNDCDCPECQKRRAAESGENITDKSVVVDGVISLLQGEKMNIEPASIKRHERHNK